MIHRIRVIKLTILHSWIKFIGQDLKKDVEVEKNDAVTEATFSSKSTVRAVEEVRKALGY